MTDYSSLFSFPHKIAPTHLLLFQTGLRRRMKSSESKTEKLNLRTSLVRTPQSSLAERRTILSKFSFSTCLNWTFLEWSHFFNYRQNYYVKI